MNMNYPSSIWIFRLLLLVIACLPVAAADPGHLMEACTLARNNIILKYYLAEPARAEKLVKLASPEWKDIGAAELEKRSQKLLARVGVKGMELATITSYECRMKRIKQGLIWYYVVGLEDPKYQLRKGNWAPISVALFADGSEPILEVVKFEP